MSYNDSLRKLVINIICTYLLIKSTNQPRGLCGSDGDLANNSASFNTPHGLVAFVVLFPPKTGVSFSELSFKLDVGVLLFSLFTGCCCCCAESVCDADGPLVTASVVTDEPCDNDDVDDEEDVGADVLVDVVLALVFVTVNGTVAGADAGIADDVDATPSVIAGALLIIVNCSDCRDILNVLNLLSGSKTTDNSSKRYGLSRVICRADNCINFPHVFNMQ